MGFLLAGKTTQKNPTFYHFIPLLLKTFYRAAKMGFKKFMI